MTSILRNPLKYLLVDDRLVSNSQNRKNFVKELGVDQDYGLFAQDYNEALSLIQKNKDIAVCYVDLRIPKDSTPTGISQLQSPDGQEWGILLIPLINKILQSARIVIYSAHVQHEEIEEFAASFNNILGVFGKPNKLRHLQQLYFTAIEEISEFNIPISTKRSSKRTPLELKTPDFSDNYPEKTTTKDDKKQQSTQSVAKKIASNKKPRKSSSGNFDYSHLDKETREFIQNRTVEIKSLVRKTVEDIIEIGRYLYEVKARLSGQFMVWLDYEMQWSTATAARFISSYERVTELDIDVSKYEIYPTALYLLTPRTMPDSALLEMKALAETGQVINSKIAKEIREKHFKSKPRTKTPEVQVSSDFLFPDSEELENLGTSPAELSEITTIETKAEDIDDTDSANIIPKQDIVRVLHRQSIWKLGRNLLICADPHSDNFIKHLPSKTSLCLAFPQDKHWHFLPKLNLSDSFTIFHTPQNNKASNDIELLLDAVQNLIDLTTKANDSVVICFCPNPGIIRVVNDLDCQAIIAEPNYEQCLNLVEIFNESKFLKE